jgi:hypothetical protein
VLKLVEGPTTLAVILRIVRVHKDIGTGLQLVVEPAARLEAKGARAGTGHRPARQIVLTQQGHRLARSFHRRVNCRAALVKIPYMLCAALIYLQPRESKRSGRRDTPGERQRGRAGRDPATVSPHVDLHQHVEGCAGGRRGAIEGGNVVGIVHAHPQSGLPGKGRQVRDLSFPHDLVGYQHVTHAALNEGLGFTHLLATHPHCPQGYLTQRDDGALVGLRVGAKAHTGSLACVRHSGQIRFESIEIDDQRRCIHLIEAHTDIGRWSYGHGIGTP